MCVWVCFRPWKWKLSIKAADATNATLTDNQNTTKQHRGNNKRGNYQLDHNPDISLKADIWPNSDQLFWAGNLLMRLNKLCGEKVAETTTTHSLSAENAADLQFLWKIHLGRFFRPGQANRFSSDLKRCHDVFLFSCGFFLYASFASSLKGKVHWGVRAWGAKFIFKWKCLWKSLMNN